jgi:hypothetical protein
VELTDRRLAWDAFDPRRERTLSVEEHRHNKTRRRGLLAALLSAAAVAVALPVTGALANGDSGATAGGSSAAGSLPVQTQDRPAPRDDSSPRDDGDCPEKDGAGGSVSDASVQL